MKKIKKWLCSINLHNYNKLAPNMRKCKWCGKTQTRKSDPWGLTHTKWKDN